MAEQLDRRAFIVRGVWTAAGAAALGGSASSLLAACSSGSGSSGSSSPASATGTPGVSSATPKRGGSVTIAVTSEESGFDPSSSAFDPTGYLYASAVFDTLAALDSTGKPQPYLAQSIEPNSDYTIWTIGLRPGISFHDGIPLDATALKTNLDDRRSGSLTGESLKPVSDVVVTGPMTVEVRMSSPWVPFPYYMTAQPGYIVSPAMIANKASGTRNPVGTGPFVFETWVPNDHFSARRNEHYWRQGLPYLDGIEFKPIIDSTAAQNTLKAGGVDVAAFTDPHAIAAMRSDPSFVTIDDSKQEAVEPNVACVMLNTAVPPVDDIRVRQALAYAINRERAVQILGAGVNKVANGLFPPGNPSYEADNGYPNYDPARARALVRDYEQDHGPISIELFATPVPYVVDAAQLIQADWKSVGVSTKISQIEQTQLIVDATEGKFQATLWEQFQVADPDENYVFWSPTTVAPVGQIALNFPRNKDPQIEAALQQGRTQSDPAVRANAYKTVARRLAQDLPYLWVSYTVTAVSAQPKVQNFDYNTLPSGARAYGMTYGVFPTVQIWKQT